MQGVGPHRRRLALGLSNSRRDGLRGPCRRHAARELAEWRGRDARRMGRLLLEVCRVDLPVTRSVEVCVLGAFERAMHKRVVHPQRRGELSEGPPVFLVREGAGEDGGL